MKGIPVADTRSFAILGHSGCGKTTLIDTFLAKLGANERLGSVSAGTSAADYTDEEVSRKITVYAKPFSGIYKRGGGGAAHMVFFDTPGYADFHGQVVSATRVADAALVVIDAASGIQVGTNIVWKRCNTLNMPRGIVITGLDRESADFGKTLAGIRKVWGEKCVPVVAPVPGNAAVYDALGGNAPPQCAAEAEAVRGKLVETAAETSDALIEKYLGGGQLSPDEVSTGLRAAVRTGKLVPVFACMPLKDCGVAELLEGIIRCFPSPADVEVKDASGNAVKQAADAPFVGFVWRTVMDPYVGQLTFVRVYGGTLKADADIKNASKGQKERVASLLLVNGKKQETVTEATAGDVVALPKLKQTALGDTLCDLNASIKLSPITFPNPVISYAVHAKTRGDEDKIGTALARVSEEDPTLRMERNSDTKEILLSGMGEVHIEAAVERMKKRSNVEVLLSTPKVPYKETVTALGEGHYRHKKQTGGRGQYGEVYLRVEPKQPDDEEWFVDAVVGGVIPNNFIPAVQKGVVEGMTRGAVAGYPVTDVKITVHDGSYHDVDSSEISFKIAGARAFKDAMSKARPVLREPIMKIKVMIPDRHMGDIAGDLNQKRGRILGVGTEDGMQVVSAEAPLAEMFRYAAELRSITAGQGSFEMEFARYEIVPSNVTVKIVAAAQTQKEEED